MKVKAIFAGIIFASAALMAADGATLYKKCVACHGPTGDKIAPGSKGGKTINGADKALLVKKMKGYEAGTEDNGGAKQIMYNNMKMWKFTDEDLEVLADHIAKFPATASTVKE